MKDCVQVKGKTKTRQNSKVISVHFAITVTTDQTGMVNVETAVLREAEGQQDVP